MINGNEQYGAILRERTHVSGNDMPSVLRSVWRKRRIPLLGLCAGAALGMALLFASPPLYSANARIMLDSRQSEGMLNSEVEIIGSTPVLAKVAGVLNLYRDPFFSRPSTFETLIAPDNDENAQRDRVLNRLSRIMNVRSLEGTHIIDITVRHPSPRRAAQIANVILSSYQDRKNDERLEQSRLLSNWMERRLIDLKEQASDAREKYEAMIKEAGNRSAAADTAARIAAIAHDITRTRAEITLLEARLAHGSVKGGAQSNTLKILNGQLAELSRRYGEKHPKIIAKKAEIARVRKLGPSVAVVQPPSQAEIDAAQARLKNLEIEMAQLNAGNNPQSTQQHDLKTIENEVATNERLYENLRVKYQDLVAQAELQAVDMKVVSMATIPAQPERALRLLVVLALAGLGFAGTLLVVVCNVLWNASFTSVTQLENMTGYPVFASIPAAGGKGFAVHHSVIENPAALLAESLRSLRVSLRLRADRGVRPRVVALTSTLPDEGKTSLAVMLAVVAAKSGERVVVVDCDLRRPSVHRTFGIGNARGLQDYMNGTLALDDVIYRKDSSGVHLITTKAVPSYSLTLLTSGRMEKLIEELRERYDLVILDAPSSLAFADARVLARMVDQTLYVVAWNRTRRDSTMASLKAYADMGYTDLALVLNKVALHDYLRDSASAVIYRYGQDMSETQGQERGGRDEEA